MLVIKQDDKQEIIERMRLQMAEFTAIREDLYQKRLLHENRNLTYSTNVITPPPPGPTVINVIDTLVTIRVRGGMPPSANTHQIVGETDRLNDLAHQTYHKHLFDDIPTLC